MPGSTSAPLRSTGVSSGSLAIDCALEERAAYLYSTLDEDALRAEAHAARAWA